MGMKKPLFKLLLHYHEPTTDRQLLAIIHTAATAAAAAIKAQLGNEQLTLLLTSFNFSSFFPGAVFRWWFELSHRPHRSDRFLVGSGLVSFRLGLVG